MTVLLAIRITCLSHYCSSELALWKSGEACWSSTKQRPSSSHWHTICYRHEIAETLLTWP